MKLWITVEQIEEFYNTTQHQPHSSVYKEVDVDPETIEEIQEGFKNYVRLQFKLKQLYLQAK